MVYLFLCSGSGVNKKNEPIPPPAHSRWMGETHHAALLYSDSQETPLQLENMDEHCSHCWLQPLIKQLLSNRAVKQKSVGISTSV